MKRRKKWKKKAAGLAAVVAAVLALLYARCSGGFGFGGGGSSDEAADDNIAIQPATGVAVDATTPACAVRVDQSGLQVAGKPCNIPDVARCCASSSATLIVTGDAVQGDADETRRFLREGGIEILERQPSTTR